MIWALLALLGVPIWLVVGALGAAIWSRRQFAGQPDVVRVKLRPLGQPWPRRRAYARAVHDVLVVNSGLALVRTTMHGVHQATADDGAAAPVKGIDDPVIFALKFDDGSQALLAVPAAARASFQALTTSARDRRGSAAELTQDQS
jgi:hypothetical protein